MYRKIKGYLASFPVKLIAVVLVAILIPSLLITALGLVTVSEADRFVREFVTDPYQEKLDAACSRIGEVWRRRLERLQERLRDAHERRHYLAGLREDLHVRDLLVSDASGLHLVPPRVAHPVLEGQRDHPDLVAARRLETDGAVRRALGEYGTILDACEGQDGVAVEALLGLARCHESLGEHREYVLAMEQLLARFGESADSMGIPRKFLILHRLLQVQSQVRPTECLSTARRLAAALEQEGASLAPEVATHLHREIARLVPQEYGPFADAPLPVRTGPLDESSLPLVERSLRRSLRRVSSSGQPASRSIRLSGREPMTFLSVPTDDKDTTVHLLLDLDAFLDEAYFYLEEVDIDRGKVRPAWMGGETLGVQPPDGEEVLASSSLPPPFDTMELRYYPEPGTSRGFRGFHIMRLATFTWAIIVLVLTIIVGIFFTLRSVLRETETARMKSDFVSFISHELKTPLAAIRMLTETLLDGRVRNEEERETCVRLIDNESERLSHLIEKVLEYSRIQRQEKVFKFASCSMENVVEEAVRLFHEHNKDQPREIEVNAVQHISKTNMDRASMVEVILNLLSNAAKYSRPQTKIVVNLRETMDDISVEVIDQGIGIRKRDQKRVFDKFFRADDYLTRDIEGTGLGLAFARYVAKVHKGEIRVSSQLNSGSTFTLQLKKTHVLAE